MSVIDAICPCTARQWGKARRLGIASTRRDSGRGRPADHRGRSAGRVAGTPRVRLGVGGQPEVGGVDRRLEALLVGLARVGGAADDVDLRRLCGQGLLAQDRGGAGADRHGRARAVGQLERVDVGDLLAREADAAPGPSRTGCRRRRRRRCPERGAGGRGPWTARPAGCGGSTGAVVRLRPACLAFADETTWTPVTAAGFGVRPVAQDALSVTTPARPTRTVVAFLTRRTSRRGCGPCGMPPSRRLRWTRVIQPPGPQR